MANYSLVANSVFQPFTYQELAAPLDRQDAYHEKLVEEYEKLSTQADVLEAMGKNDRDKKAYGQYKAYSDALRAEADNLYMNGLNSESRMRLTDLRRRYNQEIVPIQNAWNKREQEATMQLNARLNNPLLRFTRDASTTPLDNYIDNPTAGFGVVNLGLITQQMSNMAKSLAKQIREGSNQGIDAFTFEHITKHGLDPNLINAWIQNPDKYPTLTNMMNQVLETNGVSIEALKNSPNAASLLQESTRAAQMGAWDAIGEDKSQIVDKFGARENLRFVHALAEKQAPTYADLHPKDADGRYDLFSTQPGQLPIAIADGNIDDEVLKNAEAFGWKKDSRQKNGYHMTPYLDIGSSDLGAGFNANTYVKPFKVNIFDDSGNFREWGKLAKELERNLQKNEAGNSIRQQDRTRIIERVRKRYYNAKNTAKAIGIDTSKGFGMKDVNAALERQRATGGAGYVQGYHLGYDNNAWNPTAQNINVREISKVDHNGKFSFKDEQYTLGQILDSRENAKVNKSGQAADAFVTTMNGQEGIIFTIGNRQFFADMRGLATANVNGASAFEYLKKASDLAALAEKEPNELNARMMQATADNYVRTGLSLIGNAYATSTSEADASATFRPTSKQLDY